MPPYTHSAIYSVQHQGLSYLVDQKLHNEMYSRYFSKQIKNKQCQTHKIVQIHSESETVFGVSSLLLDNTFQPVTALIDGAVQFAHSMMIARLSCSLTEVKSSLAYIAVISCQYKLQKDTIIT